MSIMLNKKMPKGEICVILTLKNITHKIKISLSYGLLNYIFTKK